MPLATLKKSKEHDGRLYKLLLKLETLNYEIVYYPGVCNTTSDLLSRSNETQAVIKENTVRTESKIVAINTLDVKITIDWA